MKIIELPVIGSRSSQKENLYNLLCENALRNFEGFDLGLLKLDEEYAIHFYFMNMENENYYYLWDIILPHAIGCVLVCEWQNHQSVDINLKTIEYLERRFSTPLYICSIPANEEVPESFINEELQKGQRKLFSFNPENKESAKEILISVLES
jgi:hypothetical protein